MTTTVTKGSTTTPDSNKNGRGWWIALIVVIVLIAAWLVSAWNHWLGFSFGDDAKPAPGTVVLYPEYGDTYGVIDTQSQLPRCDPALTTVPLQQDGTVSVNDTRITTKWSDSEVTISYTSAGGSPAADSTLGLVVTKDDKVKVARLNSLNREANSFVIKTADWGSIGKVDACLSKK